MNFHDFPVEFCIFHKDHSGSVESREFGKMIRELIDPLGDDMDVRRSRTCF